MPSPTKTALASKPLRVLVDGLTLQLNSSNQIAAIPPAQTLTVGISGCNFTSIQSAINSISDASSTKPYVIKIHPGIYSEQITCKDYVHLYGIGGNIEGPACVEVIASGWVIKSAAAGAYSNIRFNLDVGVTTGTIKIVDGQGTTITPGRSVFFNCYFVITGNYGSANVKLSENNASQSTVTFASCLAYYRPSTTGTSTLIHSLTGTTDCLNFIVGHYLPTCSASVLWLKDDATTFPDEIDGITISREYPSVSITASAIVFVNNNSTNGIYVNECHGLQFVQFGSIVGGSHSGFITGQTLSTNQHMAASATTGDLQIACSTAITNTPRFGSPIVVTVNGVRVTVGDGDQTHDCYFYDGTTVKKLANVIAGDQLYWVGSVAGFQLETTDKISFDYGV